MRLVQSVLDPVDQILEILDRNLLTKLFGGLIYVERIKGRRLKR